MTTPSATPNPTVHEYFSSWCLFCTANGSLRRLTIGHGSHAPEGEQAEARLRKCTPWQVGRRYCQADVDSSTTLRMTFLRPASAALFGRPLRPTAHEYPGFWGLLSTPNLSAGSRNMDDANNMSRSTTPKSFVAETHTSPKSMNHKEEGDGNSHSHD